MRARPGVKVDRRSVIRPSGGALRPVALGLGCLGLLLAACTGPPQDPAARAGTAAVVVLPWGTDAGGKAEALSAPAYAATARTLAEAVHAHALGLPRTALVAGGPEEGVMLYVRRGLLPVVSEMLAVRVIDLGGGRATLAIRLEPRLPQRDARAADRLRAWLRTLPVAVAGEPIPGGDAVGGLPA